MSEHPRISTHPNDHVSVDQERIGDSHAQIRCAHLIQEADQLNLNILIVIGGCFNKTFLSRLLIEAVERN